MNEELFRDLEYCSIRINGGLTANAMRELYAAGAIRDYSDIGIERLRKIYAERQKYRLSDLTSTRISEMLKNANKIHEYSLQYRDAVENEKISIINKHSEYYPEMWRELNGMPDVFFAKGKISLLRYASFGGSVGIVGTRTPSRYSLYATRNFAADLGKAGIIVISGMAVGIDREAHKAALECGAGTIAVLPGGVDIIYPNQNNDIYEEICELGLVISEMPPGQKPQRQYFPSRNRLISALSDAVLIMEAGEHSGTLHTASFAASQGKDVFVLPSSIYSDNCLGGLYLLKDGAEVLINPEIVRKSVLQKAYDRVLRNGMDYSNIEHLLRADIEEINVRSLILRSETDSDSMTDEDWKRLIELRIQERPRTADGLSMILKLSFGKLSGYLTELELEGRIELLKGKYIPCFIDKDCPKC